MDNIKTYRNKKTTLVIITSIVFSILIFNFLFGQKDKKIKEFAIDKETKFVNEQHISLGKRFNELVRTGVLSQIVD